VVFDLPHQRELFREDGFTLNGMNRLVHLTNWLTASPVPPSAFEHQAGVWDLLANLVNREIQSPEQADAVVFLGAPDYIKEAMPSAFPKPDKTMQSRFYSVHYSRAGRRIVHQGAGGWQGGVGAQPGSVPAIAQDVPRPMSFDTMKQTVMRMKGRIFVVETPAGLSKAIGEIGRGK
jgi:hypothetical protein